MNALQAWCLAIDIGTDVTPAMQTLSVLIPGVVFIAAAWAFIRLARLTAHHHKAWRQSRRKVRQLQQHLHDPANQTRKEQP
ncbi:hypothetical protein [Streptomyces sp. NPDC008150]|uniref:hypothetical protein n=1 Tax=Streptomyces sp. NPDC008150 TaxID=3364816 RepID=UPI0036E945C3